MADEKLREWVREKLDEGIDEERIKRSLENTGHDPSLVDEVKSPFEGSGVDRDPFGGDIEEEQEKEMVHEQEKYQEDSGTVERRKEEGDLEDDEGSRFPEISLSVPSVPSISLPSFPRPSAKLIAVFFVVILLAGGGYLFQSSEVLEPEKQCVGVKMYSVSASGGSTVADVRVVEQADVTLEIFENGEKIADKTKEMDGRGTITVNAVGDRASFHGYDCGGKASVRNY